MSYINSNDAYFEILYWWNDVPTQLFYLHQDILEQQGFAGAVFHQLYIDTLDEPVNGFVIKWAWATRITKSPYYVLMWTKSS